MSKHTEIDKHPFAEEIRTRSSLSILIDELKRSADRHFTDRLFSPPLNRLLFLVFHLPEEQQHRCTEYQHDCCMSPIQSLIIGQYYQFYNQY